jgi:ABC-type transport system involved in multi-copper enzyme maturation permease subunit
VIDSIFLLAQAGAAGAEAAANAAAANAPAPTPPPVWIQNLLGWLYLIGDPAFTTKGVFGSLLTWTKIIGLFCLVSWIGARILSAIKQRIQLPALSGIAAAGLLGGLASILLQQLQAAGRLSLPMIAGISPAVILGVISLFAVLAWIETLLWVSMNKDSEKGDRLLLIAMHIALAYGLLNGMLIYAFAVVPPGVSVTIVDFLAQGARMGLTYMGYTALVLLLYRLFSELGMFNPVRTLAIAWLARKEANRRMWAPYVVLTVFLVVLAFTHWFLVPPRPAEMSRLFVGTLTLLCSLLITLMIIFLSPLSLPTDIQQQTIYTIVSKPVSRLELIWGRIVGYMTLVTLMIGLFGAISYIYLIRQVNSTIRLTNQEANAIRSDNPIRATQLDEQSEQLAARMSARVPIKGSLVFRDSRGTPQIKGIDVGQELEYRTHVEGATPSKGIWRYGIISHPFDEVGNMAARDAGRAPGKQNYPILDRRIPVDNFLRPGTIEYIDNQISLLNARKARGENGLDSSISSLQEQRRPLANKDAELQQALKAAQAANNQPEIDRVQNELATFHSDAFRIEMSFTIYRTTKGRVGEPVFASIKVTNPFTSEQYDNTFPVREYYTDNQLIPASLLVGSDGFLNIEIQCVSSSQYLGMAESDLFILASNGSFVLNFAKGLMGVWLQALVLTSIGVFAGTFLSWPVALLTTIAFFVSGQVAFNYLQEFALSAQTGGGPFESLYRLLSHDNQMSDLTPTVAVITAKTLDSLIMPIMSRLVYVVPNFASLDVSNSVADGFAVTGSKVISNTLMAVAYALPFSVAGFFILKKREVAA